MVFPWTTEAIEKLEIVGGRVSATKVEFFDRQISFIRQNSGSVGEAYGCSIPYEVIPTGGTFTRCSPYWEDGFSFVAIPVALLLRAASLYASLEDPWQSYMGTSFTDPEWHDDIPKSEFSELDIAAHFRSLPFHPSISEEFSDSILPERLLGLATAKMEYLSDKRRSELDHFLSLCLLFLINHEKAHIELHRQFKHELSALRRRDRERWEKTIRVIETDADAYAIRLIARSIFEQYLGAMASRKEGSEDGFEFATDFIGGAAGRLGAALVVMFSIMLPERRSISSFDQGTHSHPQVRIMTIQNYLQEALLREGGLPRSITDTVSTAFISSALGMMTALHLGFSGGSSTIIGKYRPPTPFVAGSMAVRRSLKRAQAIVHERKMYMNKNGQFTLNNEA